MITNQLQEIRDNAEVEFKAIIEKCTKMAELSENKLEVPRVNARQIYRSNVEFTTPEEYYCRTIFIPFIDSLIQQLNERFSGKTKSAMSGMYLIPSVVEKLSKSEIFEYYQSDLPSKSSFSEEIQLWKRNWANEKSVPTTLSETLKYIITKNMKEIFPNVTRILSILQTPAATSASIKRSNSALGYVKANFRSMMGEERLNALLLLYIHQDTFLDFDKIIDM